MKVALTGWNGFLSTKLKERTDVEWVEYPEEADVLLLMGSPTFTDTELDIHDAQVMHQYVRETIKIVDRFSGHIIFASTTGVDDLQFDHKGSTSYNLAKLYLENYILYEADSCAILRIGTIVSDKISDVNLMKPDRVQPKAHRGVWPQWEDKYLMVNEFVNTTLDAILTKKQGIIEYPLVTLNIAQLKSLAK